MSLSTLSMFSFLITYSFWSRVGFFISYIATSFIALEIFRLIYTDVNKREVEKFLESYSKQRNSSPRRRQQEDLKSISIEDLERPVPSVPTRTSTRRTSATTHESDKTLINDEHHQQQRRKKKTQQPTTTTTTTHISAPTHAATQPHVSSSSPTRRLRKRSDTLNSTSSVEAKVSESKGLFSRRRRSASPASDVSSKASSRHASPLRRSRERKEGLGLGLGLGKTVRTKV